MRRKSPRTRANAAEKHRHIDGLPERSDIREALGQIGKPIRPDALVRHLDVTPGEAAAALGRRISAMVRDGQLLETRNGRVGLPERMELVAGRVLAHRDGYAFVRPEIGGDDIFLAPREARRTLHGDKVLVRVAGEDHRGRPNGHLVEVIERANEQVVGRYFRSHGVGIVVPDNSRINQDVLVPDDRAGGASDGQIVVAAIDEQPGRHSQPVGSVIEILGEHMAPGMEIEVAIRSHGIPSEWPQEVLDQAAEVTETISRREIGRRRDLRELPLVTIDGSDARDFDDAVCARRTPNGFVLHVAIADVAHYVTPDSELDTEARRRGTSVYFPDRVVPMLPEALSNGVCSLMPQVDRLALVCELSIRDDGEVRRSRFYNAVIRSHARLVYTDVQAWFDGDRATGGDIDEGVAKSLATLYELYDVLRTAREARGALDIDTVEPRFEFDRKGKIARVTGTSRVDAHRLIEECMVTANVAAARYLLKHRLAAVFRIHEPPDESRVEELGESLRQLGLRFPAHGAPDSLVFADALRRARKRRDQRLIETMVLRSLKLAVYSPHNAGHFGLALAAYAHFTSPIRRYPDLLVHRAIKAKLAQDEATLAAELMPDLAERCSMCERRADEATRDAVNWLKCEFMLDKVGERFGGLITGVAEFGIFVELNDIFVEGLVHVSELPDDYYQFDASRHALTGRAGGQRYRIGDPVEVIVSRVDLDERKIDFKPVAPHARKRGGRRR